MSENEENPCEYCKSLDECNCGKAAIDSIPFCLVCQKRMFLFFRSGVSAERKGSQMGWIWKCTQRFEKWHKKVEELVKTPAISTHERTKQSILQRVGDFNCLIAREINENIESREESLKIDTSFEYFEDDEMNAHFYPYRVWIAEPSLGSSWIRNNITEDFLFFWVPAAAPRNAMFKTLKDADKYAELAINSCLMNIWEECSEVVQGIHARCRCGRTYCKVHHADPSEPCAFCQKRRSGVKLTLARVKKMNKGNYPLIS